ncbi:DUF2461 domain-containing protein [Enhygromyxa salina]|uniref:TIGR02453 family protein n=1 Tax=Enhygromyxa salina TaxID=215803 RepID=A0A2S9YR52_9BACT|nr:DUF2461 domain-containing protein [Enhygromyxa salina]PRQ07558.1 hypothetical protein ENSA7_25480 [Enhygromyxa salina]
MAAAQKSSKPPKFTGFTPDLVQFLGELSLNNDREWFEANKTRYEQQVREPALAFIRALGPKLSKVSKHFVASDKKVGGSLMRIHRDVRFSTDKTPYKTNLGVQFRHEVGKDVHAPGFYVHVDTEGVFLAAGTWKPDADTLGSIRQRISTEGPAWKRARDNAKFVAQWELGGESLTRPPRGFAKDHPLIDDLRRKDHIAVCKLSVDEILGPKSIDLVAARFALTKPYVSFLCKAIDVPF